MAAEWTVTVERYNDDSGESRVHILAIWDDTNSLGQRYAYPESVAWPATSPAIATFRTNFLGRAESRRNAYLARRGGEAQIANTIGTYMNAQGTNPP